MHPILRYIEKEGLTKAEFARRAGFSPQFLQDVLNGRTPLGRVSALGVVGAADGALTLEQVLTWQPPHNRRRGRAA